MTKGEALEVVLRALEGGAFDDLVAKYHDSLDGYRDVLEQMDERARALAGDVVGRPFLAWLTAPHPFDRAMREATQRVFRREP